MTDPGRQQYAFLRPPKAGVDQSRILGSAQGVSSELKFAAVVDERLSDTASNTVAASGTPTATPAESVSGSGTTAPSASPSTALSESVTPSPLPAPSSVVPQQRPRPDTDERTLTSHTFQEISVVSLNPPMPPAALPAPWGPELQTRLIVTVALGVHSGFYQFSADNNWPYDSMPLFNTMLASWWPTLQPHHHYRCVASGTMRLMVYGCGLVYFARRSTCYCLLQCMLVDE